MIVRICELPDRIRSISTRQSANHVTANRSRRYGLQRPERHVHRSQDAHGRRDRSRPPRHGGRPHRARHGQPARQRPGRGLRREDADQPGRDALGAGAGADRRAAVRSVADGRHRKGDPRIRPRAQPGERRQGRAHPDSGADRRAPQGALAARAQAGRGRTQRRPPGAPRRQRAAEEAAQGAQDFRRRRAEGPRADPEDDRRARQADRRSAEEEGPGPTRRH